MTPRSESGVVLERALLPLLNKEGPQARQRIVASALLHVNSTGMSAKQTVPDLKHS